MAQFKNVYWEDVKEGDTLPEISLPISVRRCVMDAAWTHDFFPGHHDRDYARGQGQKDMYVNTMMYQGFLHRLMTDWSGPEGWVKKLGISMRASVYPGHTMKASGKVIRKYTDNNDHLVDLELLVSTEDGPAVPATGTVLLPTRG